VLGIAAVGVGVVATRGLLHRIEPLAFDPRDED
jgi:hypothetical protein